MDWPAKWIWVEKDNNSKNLWVCFRKTFFINEKFESSNIQITADSRYYLYINGQYVNYGPVRCWPQEQSYDEIDIKRYLKQGKNVIAVLVNHYGISTFQYINGKPGLTAQVEINYIKHTEKIATDTTWKSHMDEGYLNYADRINCQQPWVEIYDSDKFDIDWIKSNYNDDNWDKPVELNNYEKTNLIKRDIPLLREDIVYPSRIEYLRKVKPKGNFLSINLQECFFKDRLDANPVMFEGFIAANIYSDCTNKGKVYFPWDNWLSIYGNFKINNKIYKIEDGINEVDIELNCGDNFFLMDVSGEYHGLFLYLNMDTLCNIRFTNPLLKDCEFVSIGPFNAKSIINNGLNYEDGFSGKSNICEKIWQSESFSDLNKFIDYIRPVENKYINHESIYMESIYRDVTENMSVTDNINNMIIPNGEYAVINSDGSSDIEITVDFGKEVTGFIEFEIDADEKTIIDFYGIECIRCDGSIEHTEGLNNTLRYITSDGMQCYRSKIRRGFRYLQVTLRNLKGPLRFYRIFINNSTYPAVSDGKFECSDYLLNRIFEMSRYTTQLCMEDVFVDCPAYEQTFWVGDFRNEALVNYYTFASYKLIKRCIKLVAESLRRSKFPESQVPSGWQNVLTTWGLLWMESCKEYYDYTGDMVFLNEIFPSLEKSAEAYISMINDEGLIEIKAWNMLEWAPMDTPSDGIVTHINAELSKVLYDTAEVAGLIGLDDLRDRYMKFSLKLKEAINKYLWNDKKSAYFDSIRFNGEISSTISLQTNIMAYVCGCAEDIRKEKIEEYLFDCPPDFVHIGSPFMYHFYFEALLKCCGKKKIVDLIREKWGDMLDEGATTCYETFPGFTKDRLTRSHCHAWSAAPGYFLPACIIGITSLAPGFKKVLINPEPCGLKWARGSVPIPAGRIDTSWEVIDGSLNVTVRCPKSVDITFGENVNDFKIYYV